MARPKNCRQISALPGYSLFKPMGVPARSLPEVTLTVDEFEAIRLADQQGLYQEEAATRMGVSRQTFGRIVDAARTKIATALVEGYAIRIEGGEVRIADIRRFQCGDCRHAWELARGLGRPSGCPSCESQNFHRLTDAADSTGTDLQRKSRGRCCTSRNRGSAGQNRAG